VRIPSLDSRLGIFVFGLQFQRCGNFKRQGSFILAIELAGNRLNIGSVAKQSISVYYIVDHQTNFYVAIFC
jgi:hypothetical protein